MKTEHFERWLASLDDQNAILVTANERLARMLNEKLHAEHKNLHLRVTSLNAFIDSMWFDAQNAVLQGSNARLLTNDQSLYIWQQLLNIKNDSNDNNENNELQDVIKDDYALVNTLFEAYTTHIKWQLNEDDITQQSNNQVELYLSLKSHFDSVCRQKYWITQVKACEKLVAYFSAQYLEHYCAIGLYGFNDISPLEHALFKACASQTVTITLSPKSSELNGHTYNNPTDEIKAAAAWAHAIYKQDKTVNIGVVIPTLHKDKNNIELLFSREFCPHQHMQFSSINAAKLPYEVTLGTKLMNEPIIDSLFLLLELNKTQIDIDQAHRLLHCPFWGCPDSAQRIHAINQLQNWDRAKLDVSQLARWLTIDDATQMQNALQPHSTLSTANTTSPLGNKNDNTTHTINSGDNTALNYSNTSSHASSCAPSNISCLEALNNAQSFYLSVKYQSNCLADWRHFLQQWLKALNWPGPRSVNSREYQAIMMFMSLLDELKQDDHLSIDQQNKTYSAFVSHIKRKTALRVFKLQTEPKSIKIMGTLEAIGAQFDYCWMTNASSQQFPEKANPNPFLPYALQKTHQTPKASAEKELHYAQSVLTRFCSHASHMTFSYCRLIDDTHCLPTPLLNNKVAFELQPRTVNALDEQQAKLTKTDAVSVYNQTQGKMIGATNPIQLKSGIKVIENTAIAPIWAYFIHRLGAKQPQNSYLGITPIERGNTVHIVLADILKNHSNNAALKTLFDEDNQPLPTTLNLIEKQVNHTLKREIDHVRALIPLPLIALETTRLSNAIIQFLLADSQRTAFSVLTLEEKYTLNVNFQDKHITFDVIIDRIDTTIDNETIIFDYKTGQVNIDDTLKTPLLNAQLPAYSLVKTSLPVHAVAFVQIATGAQPYQGLGELKHDIEGIDKRYEKKLIVNDTQQKPENWQDMQAFWQAQMTDTLNQFCLANITSQTSVQVQPYQRYLNTLTRDFEQAHLTQLFFERSSQNTPLSQHSK